MNKGKICVSICGRTTDETLEKVRGAEAFADVIEIRFDCLEPSQIEGASESVRSINRTVLITFRPREQGGRRELSRTDRREFWDRVIPRLESCDFLIDNESDLDLSLGFDPERTIVSLHDFENKVTDLAGQLDVLSRLAATTAKVAIAANDAVEAIDVWKLLERSNEKLVIPIAMGEAGKWTRILGLAHGAPMTYASFDAGDETAPGQVTAEDLLEVYRVKELDRDTKVYGVVAGETSYSRSPYMHNAAFRHAGMNSVFVPLKVMDLDAFVRRMVRPETREIELNFRGFSVTNPHKQAITRHLDDIDEVARTIGAVNTVKIENGKLLGYNTDAGGFIGPLKKMYGDLKGARAAVVGAGGAARACVYALQQAGADITICARDASKASNLAGEFGVRASQLATDGQLLTTDILVNATPLGTKGVRENESVAKADELRDVKLVYDLVYNPIETRLLREAKIAGAKTLGGLDMLIAQGAAQFEIWTDHKAPVDEMRRAIVERLK